MSVAEITVNETPPRYLAEEIHARIAKSEQDVLCGNTTLAEEMESRLENKYPWLC